MAEPHHPWQSAVLQVFHPNAKIVPACPDSPDSLCTVTALQSISPDELILAISPDDTQTRALHTDL